MHLIPSYHISRRSFLNGFVTVSAAAAAPGLLSCAPPAGVLFWVFAKTVLEEGTLAVIQALLERSKLPLIIQKVFSTASFKTVMHIITANIPIWLSEAESGFKKYYVEALNNTQRDVYMPPLLLKVAETDRDKTQYSTTVPLPHWKLIKPGERFKSPEFNIDSRLPLGFKQINISATKDGWVFRPDESRNTVYVG